MDTESARIVFQHYRKILLVLHAVAAFACAGSTIHHLAVLVQYHRGRFGRAWLEKLHTQVLLGCYGATFLLGLLNYPTYRVRVRAAFFDRELPAASNLFDLKETWAAIGLPLAIGLFVMGRSLDPRDDRESLLFYTFLSAALTVIVWFNLVAGILTVSFRSV